MEILYLRGAADIVSALHDLALDPGLWVLARLPAGSEPLDGHIAVYGSLPAGQGDAE